MESAITRMIFNYSFFSLCSRAHYFKSDERQGVLVRESFYFSSGREAKEEIRSRLKILQRLDGLLNSSHSIINSSFEEEPVFLIKFFKSNEATFYRLSNRVLQVNFYDNCRLIFSGEGHLITFVDQEKRCLAFRSDTSRTHLSSLITRKLQYVHDVMASMISQQ